MTLQTRPALERTRHPTMAEAALAELRDSILSGELAPGAPLRLEELADRLGMSISPVREAVRRLESLGLAVYIPHRGARVSELALDDLRDTYEVRLVLEPLAVRRAAARFTAQDAATARARLADYAEAHDRGDASSARTAHTAFHFALYAAAGSEWLLRLIRPAWENCERYRAISLQGRTVPSVEQEHERILAACVSHDPERAAAELTHHLAATANLAAHQIGSDDLFAT